MTLVSRSLSCTTSTLLSEVPTSTSNSPECDSCGGTMAIDVYVRSAPRPVRNE